MRITVVGPTYPYKGGVALHTTQLAIQLAKAGHQVRLETWLRQYPKFLYPGHLESHDPTVPQYSNVGRRLMWDRPCSWTRVGRSVAPSDLLVIAIVTPIQVPAYLALVRSARRANPRVRVTLICHNVRPHEPRPGDSALIRAMLRSSDRTVVHSHAEAAEALQLGARCVVEASLPYHGPAPAERQARRAATAEARRRLLFFGIVRPYKGLDLLVRAVAEVPDVDLVVAGEFWGGLEAKARRLASDLGVGDRIDFRPGYVREQEVAELFAECDALVLPYYEATGSQLVEVSFLHGRPVIASTAGALGRSIAPGVNGLLFEPGDLVGLRRAIVQLYGGETLQRLTAGVLSRDVLRDWSPYLTQVLGGVTNGESA